MHVFPGDRFRFQKAGVNKNGEYVTRLAQAAAVFAAELSEADGLAVPRDGRVGEHHHRVQMRERGAPLR
jgi:hypothetical protein